LAINFLFFLVSSFFGIAKYAIFICAEKFIKQHLVIKSMRLTKKSTLLSLCLALPLGGFLCQSAESAPLPQLAYPETIVVPARQSIASPVGTWDLNLTFPGNPTIFKTVFTFAPGGGFNAIANDAPASSATSVVGVWARTGSNSFELSFIRYLFQPPLPPPFDQAVVLRGHQTFTLTGMPQHFTGEATVNFFDNIGNLLGTITSNTEGIRLSINPGK
jgi:hypothetical protein